MKRITIVRAADRVRESWVFVPGKNMGTVRCVLYVYAERKGWIYRTIDSWWNRFPFRWDRSRITFLRTYPEIPDDVMVEASQKLWR